LGGGGARPRVVSWDRSQRSACLSYSTTGSPEGSVQSGIAKPCQRSPVRVGPDKRLPCLSYTAKLTLSISTKLSGPTAPTGSGGVKRRVGGLSRFPNPSKFSNGVGIVAALLRAAYIDGCTAASPEKPLDLGTGPRSGRISRSTEKGTADILDVRERFRTAGDRSNATAFETFACGGLKVPETRTWAVGRGIKLVKLIIVGIVTERAKTVFILMGIPPE